MKLSKDKNVLHKKTVESNSVSPAKVIIKPFSKEKLKLRYEGMTPGKNPPVSTERSP